MTCCIQTRLIFPIVSSRVPPSLLLPSPSPLLSSSSLSDLLPLRFPRVVLAAPTVLVTLVAPGIPLEYFAQVAPLSSTNNGTNNGITNGRTNGRTNGAANVSGARNGNGSNVSNGSNGSNGAVVNAGTVNVKALLPNYDVDQVRK